MNAEAQMHAFGEILDPSSQTRVVDLPLLRSYCSRGITDYPPWIRPRIWRLLLGSLPPEKDRWVAESTKSRDSYYAIASKFLGELQDMPEPEFPLSTHDKLVDSISKDVDRTQPRVPFFKTQTESSVLCPLNPLPKGSPVEDLNGTPLPPRIESAHHIFQRLEKIRDYSRLRKRSGSSQPSASLSPPLATPQIVLSPSMFEEDIKPEADPGSPPPATTPSMTPRLSLTSSDDGSSSVSLLDSHEIPIPVPKHSQVLLRILYLFSMTHPHQPYTQGLNDLLAPLYYALCMELDDSEIAHVEADAFWLFSHLISEVGGVVGEPGDWDKQISTIGAGRPLDSVKSAMMEFSNRLKWADIQLWEDLSRKSLDPALPYYSYRWVACLLAQDLPLKDVLRLWDTILAQPLSTPDSNPRLSFLLDICTSMLIRIRVRLIRTGNQTSYSGGLWGDEYIDADALHATPALNVDQGGAMGEGFIEGMTLLQSYPLKTIGLRTVIEGAWDLTNRRKREEEAGARGPGALASVSSRLRDQIWKGITNQVEPEDEDASDSSETGAETEKEKAREKAIDKVERETAEEVPSIAPAGTGAGAIPKLRQYAVALKDSDAAASLAKASTNWTVAAKEALNKSSQAKQETREAPPPSPPASGSKLWQYAEAFRSSDAAASISKVSTNWTAAALNRWTAKPAFSSPLNPVTPLPPTPENVSTDRRNRGGGSLGQWSSFFGGGDSPTPLTTASGPVQQAADWGSPGRDTRNSLPVPSRSSAAASQLPRRGSSPVRPSSDFAGATPYAAAPRPKHFADPRDSIVGGRGDYASSSGYGSQPDSSTEDGGSRATKGWSSTLAALSGSSTPNSPSQTPKRAPKPLLLGTSAAGRMSMPVSPGRQRSDSRDSTSTMSSVSSPVVANIKRSPPSTSGNGAPSTLDDATSPKSESEPPLNGGVVPLRAVGLNRTTGSSALARRSRAAQPQRAPRYPAETGETVPPVPKMPPRGFNKEGDGSTRGSPSSEIRRVALTDAPVSKPPLSIQTPKGDGYSSPSSISAPRVDRTKVKTKRTYPPKGVAAAMSPLGDSDGRASPNDNLNPRAYGSPMDEAQHATLTPRLSLYDEKTKTPTFAEHMAHSASKPPRSPIMKSPRRGKRALSREDQVAFSEEEGARADDEDDYSDLLSAYSEADGGSQRRSIVET